MTEFKPRIGNYGTLATGTLSGFFIQLGTECKQDHAILYAGFRDGVESILEAKPSGGVQFSLSGNHLNLTAVPNKVIDCALLTTPCPPSIENRMPITPSAFKWAASIRNCLSALFRAVFARWALPSRVHAEFPEPAINPKCSDISLPWIFEVVLKIIRLADSLSFPSPRSVDSASTAIALHLGQVE